MLSPVKIWRRQKEIRELLGKTGRIITWTIIYVSGKGFKQYTPYPVVMVEFINKKRSIGQLVDYKKEELRIGQIVKGVLRKVRQGSKEGVIAYGIKFKPISSNPNESN